MTQDNKLPTQEKDGTVKHLTRLFSRCADECPDATFQLDRSEVDGPGWISRQFTTSPEGLANGAQWAMDWNSAGWNIYVGENPRKAGLDPNKSATDNDVMCSFFSFADLDTQASIDIATEGMPIKNTATTNTGTIPSRRVHLHWEHENPIYNLEAWKQTQIGLANYFKGDKVIDPRRILRLAGCISYPTKKKVAKGYVAELVTFHTEFDGEERDLVDTVHMHNEYAGSPAASVTPGREGSTGGLGLPTSSPGVELQKTLEAIQEGTWHNAVRDQVASWVALGWPADAIRLSCFAFTQPGYTNEDTGREVDAMLRGAVKKGYAPVETVENPQNKAAWDSMVAKQDGPPVVIDHDTGEVVEDDYDPNRNSLAAWLKMKLPPRDYTLGKIMCTTSRWLLYGQTGLGKTLFVFNMTAAVAAGKPFLGWAGGKQRRVLYLDGEMPKETFKERMEQIAEIYEPNIPFFGLNRDQLGDEGMPPLNTDVGEAWLIKQIDRYKPDLIVFDSIMCLLQGNMKEEEPWEPVKAMIRRITSLRIAQIWMDHAGHNSTKAYGTSTKMWEMDTVIRLERRENNDPGFKIEFEKARLRTDNNMVEFIPQNVALIENQWHHEDVVEGNGSKKADLKVNIVDAINNLADTKRLGLDGKAVVATTMDQVRDQLKVRGYLDVNDQGNLTQAVMTRFSRAKDDLLAQGKIAIHSKAVWVIPKGLGL